MAYTSRKSSFSAPATAPARHVSPPSVVRTNVPPVPQAQTTLALTMPNPSRLASVFDFCACHCAKAGVEVVKLQASARMTRSFFVSVSSEIIFDHRCIFHDKPNALKLCDICDRIAGNGDDVCEFSGFDGTHAILPAQHCRGVRGNCANHRQASARLARRVNSGGRPG